MSSIIKLCLLFLSGLYLSSCATIIGGWSNTLVLRSESGQSAEVYLDGEYIGEAPDAIKLPPRRIQHGSTLRLEAEGYQPVEYTILRRPSAPYVIADVVSTFGLALLVDFADGHIYRPRPRKIEYDLEKKP